MLVGLLSQVFVPIKSAFNVAQVSLASCTFFQTLDMMGGLQTARYLLGLTLVIFGVLLITLRPDTQQRRDERQSNQDSSGSEAAEQWQNPVAGSYEYSYRANNHK